MSRPLSNLDYLLGNRDALEKSNTPANPSASYVDEAAVALGGPILSALNQSPQGERNALDLVDQLKTRLEELFPVLDILAGRFGWIEIDKSDPKGNYAVTLTPRGREYYQRTLGRK